MIVPSQKPFFIDHPELQPRYETNECEVLGSTMWLWSDISESWHALRFYGLAQFFTEIGMCYAYWLSLRDIDIHDPNLLLFHGNNVVLRVVSCWDRMGSFLNDLYDLGISQHDVSFGAVIQEMNRQSVALRKHRRQLQRLFDSDSEIRDWRHRYVHRHGEHYSVDRNASLVTEAISFQREDLQGMVDELDEIFASSFDRLKSAMHVCADILGDAPAW